MKRMAIFLAAVAVCCEDTMAGWPPNPYSFQYNAGRFPGYMDRTQSEASNGFGRDQGSYSFQGDENGFHPSWINYEDVVQPPSDTEEVRHAKQMHRMLYENIAASNSRALLRRYPQESDSVQRGRDRHFDLYRRIAAQHAAIGAERAAGQWA